MRYTRKDLVLRYLKTYLVYFAALIVFILGVLYIQKSGSELWSAVGVAFISGSVVTLFTAFQNIQKRKAYSEKYINDELVLLCKNLDGIFIEAINLNKKKELDNKQKYSLLKSIAKNINLFLGYVADLNAKDMINCTFLDYEFLNYFTILKIKVEKEIDRYNKNPNYNIDWDKIKSLFIYEKEEEDRYSSSLEYLNGIEDDSIEKLKASFWTCLNINHLASYKRTGICFYVDEETKVGYYSNILREIMSLADSNIVSLVKLLRNVNYVNEDPESAVWNQYKDKIKTINVYDYADLIYQNLIVYFNSKIDNEKAIRTLRNVKVQLAYNKVKFLDFRKEAIDIVIEKLSKK